MRNNTNWFLLFVLCCLTGCKKDDANSLSLPHLAQFSETNLESFFSDHPSKEHVMKVFGKPIVQNTNSDGSEDAVYVLDFPHGNEPTGWTYRLDGFQVRYSNNTVFRWSPSYSSFEVDKSNLLIPIQRTSASESSTHHKLLFFVVSDSPLPDGRY